MKINSIPLMFIGLLCAPSAMAEPLRFRGLSAASRISDVRKVFPEAQLQNDCRKGETVGRNADGETLCDELKMADYVLDNVPFDVTFAFNPNGTLRYIALLKFYGTYRNDDSNVSAVTIKITFTSLADLISSKYGAAVSNPPISYLLGRGPVDNELEWQPERGTKWENGGDRISLKTDGRESKSMPGSFRGSVMIFYRFAKRSEFDKF